MKLDFGSIPTRIGKALQGLFGSANQRSLGQYQPIVQAVNELASWAEGLSHDDVKAAVAEMKKQAKPVETKPVEVKAPALPNGQEATA